MIESLSYLISGVIFGLAAGISPGPLLTLVISETLRHGRKEGILVSIAPIVTDIPIILITVYILSNISNFYFILGILSLAGAMFIGYLAYDSITVKDVKIDIQNVKPMPLQKGVTANFLNPHPYLFWITIGGPTLVKASHDSILSVAAFILGFYILLVGSKVSVAVLVDKSKNFLKSKTYLYIIKTTGIILILFALIFFRDGLRFLGFI
jgi:threonine/homoserine/homoserine lactone efflux protein